jgi:DNA-directed RNA polymerase specialized sigma24 family protein
VTPEEEQDFTEFVRTHGDRLLRFARLLVPDAAEAEDVLQIALLRLTSGLPGDQDNVDPAGPVPPAAVADAVD